MERSTTCRNFQIKWAVRHSIALIAWVFPAMFATPSFALQTGNIPATNDSAEPASAAKSTKVEPPQPTPTGAVSPQVTAITESVPGMLQEATSSVESIAPATGASIDRAESDTPAASNSVNAELHNHATAKRNASALIRDSTVALPELGRLQAQAALPNAMRELEHDLPRMRTELYERTERAAEAIRVATRWFAIADIEYDLRLQLMKLTSMRNRVDGQVKKSNSALERVDAILSEAQRASDESNSLGASSAVRSQLRRVIQEGKLTRKRVQRSVASVLGLQSGLSEITDEIDQALQLSSTEGPSLSRDLFRVGPNIVELVLGLDRHVVPRAAIGNVFSHHLGTARGFLTESGSRVLGHSLLGLALLLAAFWLRSRAIRLHVNSGQKDAGEYVTHPMASAALLTMAATWFVYPTCPASILIISSCFVAVIGIWFLPTLSDHTRNWHRPALYLMCVLDFVRIPLVELVSLERLLMLTEGILGAAIVAVILRHEAASPSNGSRRWSAFRRWVLRFWLTTFSVGVLTLVIGLEQTGTILIAGAATSVFASIAWAAVYRTLSGAIQVMAENGAKLKPNEPRLRRQLLARGIQTALAVICSLLWIRMTLNRLTLWDPIEESVSDLMEVSAQAGALKISVGGIAALLIGLTLAVYSAKLVRSVLEQDILPRTNLEPGTRAATSTSAYFTVMAVGVFLAIAATGVELDKLTVIVGALGVGIGFGLQNLVQNFVAGLILIFGRPVNVEDRIQVGELTGVVRRIGFRASILRTFKGAEVIVPNADLINSQVINWTLSDRERRLDIDIGVAYGTDPGQVLELLVSVAKSNPLILENPTPESLFLAHGASSLDFQLRAWTDKVSQWPNIQSDLTVAINRALKAAGIEIPFPQHDIHLRSIDPSALKALSGK